MYYFLICIFYSRMQFLCLIRIIDVPRLLICMSIKYSSIEIKIIAELLVNVISIPTCITQSFIWQQNYLGSKVTTTVAECVAKLKPLLHSL